MNQILSKTTLNAIKNGSLVYKKNKFGSMYDNKWDRIANHFLSNGYDTVNIKYVKECDQVTTGTIVAYKNDVVQFTGKVILN